MESAPHWQYSVSHFRSEVLQQVPRGMREVLASRLSAIYGQSDVSAAAAAKRHAIAVADEMGCKKAARTIARYVDNTLTHYYFPRRHRKRLRDDFALHAALREAPKAIRAVREFPDIDSAIALVALRLRRLESSAWGLRPFLDMRTATV